ncbi:MAG TPA: gamma-glutamyltransferase [Xanthobacteraceae bacterium]|jgi:gamma-glutamyltranspeptidase/glutathione hydrolase|nr:gamma-glutamyltransferase [Xanthobacteraceae bacterium]
MDLHSAGHRRGVVCAPHTATVEAGRAVLAEGGNAIEAMLAMAASIAAVYPHMNHIGGDGFWLIREPRGRIRAIMAAGPTGAQVRPALYREYETIPTRGPLAALTVPGAVGGWMLALDAAQAHGGKLPRDVLFGAAIAQARSGYTVTRSQNRLTQEHFAELKDVPGFAAMFLADGKAPPMGVTLKQDTFAATLEHLAHAGLDDFYRGDVGHEIAADWERIGSPLTRHDLERYRATLAEPLRVMIEAGTLYNTEAPTQGVVSLMILALFDRLGVKEAESFDHIHCLVEATKRALRMRDRTVTDPNYLPHALDRVLADSHLSGEAMKIDRRKAARWPVAAAAGDTIWMGAADTSGLVVSYIQSLYWEFGSGCVLPKTGVLMQNRGASFSLDAGALNYLAPGRLPFHTLNPAIAVLNDGRIMAYGCMGGDGQPQTQSALFTRHIMFREPLAEALDRPRWVLGRTWGAPKTALRLEPRFDGNLVDRLLNAGHNVEVVAEPYADLMGHAGAVVLHSNGSCEGAHDPRADGGAAGV